MRRANSSWRLNCTNVVNARVVFLPAPSGFTARAAAAMALRNPDGDGGQVHVLELQADRLADARAGRNARLADQQLRVREAREQCRRLLIREDAVGPDASLTMTAVDPLTRRHGSASWKGMTWQLDRSLSETARCIHESS